LVDQHAAHERVLFEQLQQARQGRPPQIQQLLLPETMDLNHTQAALLEQMLPELNRLGLEVEPFGGNTFVVKAVPELLAEKDLPRLILDLLEKTAEVGFANDIEEQMDQILMVMACHGAIRAGQTLDLRQMQTLIGRLRGCMHSGTCPHGRPTTCKWQLRDIHKSFQRIL
jgi:DNA mismatch repair protein MutL